MRRRPKTSSRFDAIPPGASFEDDVQLDQLRQPWSLTLGEFLGLVRERYGIAECHDEWGHYLKGSGGQVSPLPSGLSADDQLDPGETAILCRAMGVPPADFGMPDEKD